MQTSIATWLKKPKEVTQPQDEQQPTNTAAKCSIPCASAIAQPSISNVPLSATIVQPGQPQDTIQSSNVETPKLLQCSRRQTHALPPNVVFSPLTPDLVLSFRRLNSLLLPIQYPEKFYTETLEDPIISSLTLVALWRDSTHATEAQQATADKPRLVAAIRCRLLNTPSHVQGPSLYLSTIGTLSPFRSHGLASYLLETMIHKAIRMYGVSSVTAHVWAAHTESLEWYSKRGFKEVGREQDYYRRLNPSEAVLIKRDISVMDALPMDGSIGTNGG